MRRIVVIAAGMDGVRTATRIKRRLPEHEVNVIIPATAGKVPVPSGPAGRRRAAALAGLEATSSREVDVLEAHDITPDLDEKEILLRSSRGNLPVRYTDLIVEAPALARIPRSLRKAGNVFGWPQPDFGEDPAICDAALGAAAASGLPVLVAGGGMEALEAVFLAIEAGAGALWVRTGEKNTPGSDPLLAAQVLRRLADAGAAVECLPLPETTADRLDICLTPDGSLATAVRLPPKTPGGPVREKEVSCVFLTAPLLAGHPLLRERGVVLDDFGRIILERDFPPDAGLVLMGSGTALPGAEGGTPGPRFPAWPGGEETARLSALRAVDSVTGGQNAWNAEDAGGCRVFGIRRACTPGLRFFRAGFSPEEAEAHGLDVVYAVTTLSGYEYGQDDLSGDCGGSGTDSGKGMTGNAKYNASAVLEPTEADTPDAATHLCRQAPLLVLSLLCERQSRTVVGVQALGCGSRAAEADALFGMAATALAEGTSLDILARRKAFAGAAGMPATAAGIARNKLRTGIRGITPEEYVASQDAGAEFFSLDLRSLPEWRAGHIPGAYSIPLPQLKKRLQDEVPRYSPIVLISTDGRDAYAAACRLAWLGATDLYVLDGGMRLWPYALEEEDVFR